MGKAISATVIILLNWAFLFGQHPDSAINRLDAAGRKEGPWKKYDEKGMILYEGNFESGVPVGEFRYFYPDGVTKAVTTFSDHGKKAATKAYHPSGELMSEGLYIDQVKDGIWKYYNSQGTLVKDEYYSNKMKNGVWKSYYDDGQVVEETHWKDDKKNGPWVQYYNDGTKKLEGAYIDDEKQGPVTFYYPSGRTEITGEYMHSIRAGDWYYMNDSSKVTKIEHYEGGKMVKEENFVPVEPALDSIR